MNQAIILALLGGLFAGAAGTAVVTSQNDNDEDRGPRSEMRGNGGGHGYGLGFDGKGRGQRNDVHKGNCLGDECLAFDDLDYPVGELSAEAQEALNLAIQDEYKAKATYEAIIADFGGVRPFSMIVRAEEQHINALKAVYDRYGVDVPAPEAYTPEVEETLAANCQVGVDAEIANAALYRDQLLPAVEEYDDITFVFTNLMNASQDKHLPAFERCAVR